MSPVPARKTRMQLVLGSQAIKFGPCTDPLASGMQKERLQQVFREFQALQSPCMVLVLGLGLPTDRYPFGYAQSVLDAYLQGFECMRSNSLHLLALPVVWRPCSSDEVLFKASRLWAGCAVERQASSVVASSPVL